MIISCCEHVPDLFRNGDEIIILLLFLVNNSIQIIILIKRHLVEPSIFRHQIVINLPRVFLPNLLVFFLIILAQVIVPNILPPIFKPLGTDYVAVVKLLFFEDFCLVGEQLVKLEALHLQLLLWGFGVVGCRLGGGGVVVVLFAVAASVLVSAHFLVFLWRLIGLVIAWTIKYQERCNFCIKFNLLKDQLSYLYTKIFFFNSWLTINWPLIKSKVKNLNGISPNYRIGQIIKFSIL